MAEEVGTLKVGGEVDTSAIERGFRRIQSGFDTVKTKAASVNSDLQRMKINTAALGKNMAIAGVAAAGFLVNLAKDSPAVAGAMARISVQTDRLKRTLGVALKPVFDSFAEGYKKFVNFVDAHPDLTKGFVLSAAALAGIKGLTKLFGFSVSSTVLLALGKLAIIAGGAIAFGKVSEMLGGALVNSTTPKEVANIPLPPAAKQQIIDATPEELNDLDRRYGLSLTRPGPEQTARIQGGTGRLYGQAEMTQDIIKEGTRRLILMEMPDADFG